MVFGSRIYKNIDAPKVCDIQKNPFLKNILIWSIFLVKILKIFFSIASVNDIEFVVSTLFDYFDTLISTARNIDVNETNIR